MTEDERIKELVLGSKKAAKEDMDAIKAADPISYEFFAEKLRSYVLHKFLLTEEIVKDIDDFNDLTELSLSNSMKISKELVKQFDLAKSCDGASSAMAKKVLLFMAIQKELGILLPARESATFKKMSELSMMAWNEMEKNANWKAKMA